MRHGTRVHVCTCAWVREVIWIWRRARKYAWTCLPLALLITQMYYAGVPGASPPYSFTAHTATLHPLRHTTAIAPLVVGLGGRVGAAHMSANAAGGKGRDAEVYMPGRRLGYGRVHANACRRSATDCGRACTGAAQPACARLHARSRLNREATSAPWYTCTCLHVRMGT